jgi:hypothetical protein
MKRLKRFCSGVLGRLPFARAEWPREETFTQLAKLVRARRMGCFTLGYYQSNTAERPDHVTRSHTRWRSATPGDFDRVSWTVTPALPEDLVGWEPPANGSVRGHLLALSDATGNIVLFDFCTQAEAERAMREAGLGGATTYLTTRSRNPLDPELSAEFYPSYPLTKEEVRILALHWWGRYLDNESWCVVSGSSGTTERLVSEYSTLRLRAALAVLGQEAIDAIGQEAEARVRSDLEKEEAMARIRGEVPLRNGASSFGDI